MAAETIEYEGHKFLRMRLVLSTLSGRPLCVKNIRARDENPGIKDFENDLLKLIEEVTNGSVLRINEAGTEIKYRPGMLRGGIVNYECSSKDRSLGFFLEMLFCLAPFMKEPLTCTLQGLTNNRTDPSVDLLRLTSLPVLKRFIGTDEGLELKITKRGAAPDGGGEVVFKCPCRQKLRPQQIIKQGKIKRVRGVAWATRVSPQTCNRMISAARNLLNKFIPDIYIYTDHLRGPNAGNSPGFGLALVAETIEGVVFGAEKCANPKGSPDGPSVPEDIGLDAAKLLMEEVYRGGCVDSTNQSTACLMMALGDKDVSKIILGEFSPYTVQFLRHMKDFLQVVFKLDEHKTEETQGPDGQELRLGGKKYMATCVGIGFRNISKVIL